MRQQPQTIELSADQLTDVHGKFPPGCRFQDNLNTAAGRPIANTYCGTMGWAGFILPFMEQSAVYEEIDFTKRAYTDYYGVALPAGCEWTGHTCGQDYCTDTCGDEENKDVAFMCPETFRCPSTPSSRPDGAQKDYGVNGGADFPERCVSNNEYAMKWGVFYRNSGTPLAAVSKGLSNTFMVMESSHASLPNQTGQTSPGVNPFLYVSFTGPRFLHAAHYERAFHADQLGRADATGSPSPLLPSGRRQRQFLRRFDQIRFGNGRFDDLLRHVLPRSARVDGAIRFRALKN